MRSLACQLREAARAALGQGAFLRRDRGGALFVSDAPRLRPAAEWAPALEAAGFMAEASDALVRLAPGPGWLERLEARFPDPPDDFCATLARFRGVPPEAESLALFALAVKLMDGAADDGRFDRELRQRAAECLRLNRTDAPTPRSGEHRSPLPATALRSDEHRSPLGPKTTHGGGLYACALARYIIMEAIT